MELFSPPLRLLIKILLTQAVLPLLYSQTCVHTACARPGNTVQASATATNSSRSRLRERKRRGVVTSKRIVGFIGLYLVVSLEGFSPNERAKFRKILRMRERLSFQLIKRGKISHPLACGDAR